MVKKAVLILGGNQGDREALLESAKIMIQTEGVIVRESRIYQTEAWGDVADQDFLNQVLVVETEKEPLKFLVAMQKIELELGRIRQKDWGNRTIDIDILYWDREIIDLPDLKVPHLYLPMRKFVLVPLAEILPDFKHPQLHLTNEQLLAKCPDPCQVVPFQKNNPHVAG